MPYFERKGLQSTRKDLEWDVRRHYYTQLIQQVHVMVLGLDVLGNPYGLVSDFTDGFGEFFYEPCTVSWASSAAPKYSRVLAPFLMVLFHSTRAPSNPPTSSPRTCLAQRRRCLAT